MRKIAKAACLLITAALASCGAWVACAGPSDEVLVAEFEHQSVYITAEESPDCWKGSYSAYRVDEEGNVTFGCWTLSPERTAVTVTFNGNASLTLSYEQLVRVGNE